MPQANIFKWRDGEGWLILTGGGESGDEIESDALAKVAAGDPMAYIWAAGDVETADRHLTALDELGAPTGYLIDVMTEDDETIRAQLEQAGLIILGDGPNVGALRSGIVGAAVDSIGKAYERGAIILAIGAGAAVLGQCYLAHPQPLSASREGSQVAAGSTALKPGFSWLERAILLPSYEQERDAAQLRAALAQQPECFGLGLSAHSALAFSPDGNVETWGERNISVILGAAFMGEGS